MFVTPSGERDQPSADSANTSSFRQSSFKFLNLPALVELKLASGMTGSGRLKDLADVQELIRALALPREFVEKLHEYVQAKFSELWEDVHADDVAE